MSNFTTQVRYLCESFGGTARGVREIDNQIHEANKTIFDFDYPIFSEAYRTILQDKIIKHYYMREIGCETFGLWQLMLSEKMNEIMPYYNQLYSSQLLEIQPLINNLLSTTTNEQTDQNHTFSGDTATKSNSSDNTKARVQNAVSENNSSSNTSSQSTSTTNKSDGSAINQSDRTSSESNTNNDNTVNSLGTSATTTNEQLRESVNRDKTTDWNIQSDTPQGGLGNISSSSPVVSDSNVGVPNGTNIYASSITEHTNYNKSTGDSGKTQQVTENTGSNTTQSSRNGNSLSAEQNKGRNEQHTINQSDGIQNVSANAKSERSTIGDTKNDSLTEHNRVDDTKTNSLDKQQGNRDSNVLNIGLSGVSQSKLLQEWRETFLNIDKDVINELSCLFMGLYE